jgi:hypothetical protein
MHICVIGQSGEIFYDTQSSNPWSGFFRYLSDSGNSFAQTINCREIEALICLGYYPSVLEIDTIKKLSIDRKILINWEPQVVEPELYDAKYFTNFGLRLSPSDNWACKIDGASFPWPQAKIDDPPNYETWSLRENKIVIIQANKFSGHKDARYHLRRKVIWKLGIKGLLDLYGKDWHSNALLNFRWWFANARRHKFRDLSFNPVGLSQPPKKVYKGEIDSKFATYEKYQTALVIENSLDYVSEKLFDAVSAGCLTVYVGQISTTYLNDTPKELLPCPSLKEITGAIHNILNLTNMQRYTMFMQQYSNLKKHENEVLNVNVLSNLAVVCVDKLSRNEPS